MSHGDEAVKMPNGFEVKARGYSMEKLKIVTKCSHHFPVGCIYECMEISERCCVGGKLLRVLIRSLRRSWLMTFHWRARRKGTIKCYSRSQERSRVEILSRPLFLSRMMRLKPSGLLYAGVIVCKLYIKRGVSCIKNFVVAKTNS